MTDQPALCVYCDQDDQSVPLLRFQFRDRQYWICAQHFPLLIHQPSRLAEKIPGLELLKSFEGDS